MENAIKRIGENNLNKEKVLVSLSLTPVKGVGGNIHSLSIDQVSDSERERERESLGSRSVGYN